MAEVLAMDPFKMFAPYFDVPELAREVTPDEFWTALEDCLKAVTRVRRMLLLKKLTTKQVRAVAPLLFRGRYRFISGTAHWLRTWSGHDITQGIEQDPDELDRLLDLIHMIGGLRWLLGSTLELADSTHTFLQGVALRKCLDVVADTEDRLQQCRDLTRGNKLAIALRMLKRLAPNMDRRSKKARKQ